MMQRFTRLLMQAADEWNIPIRLAVALLLIPLIGSILLVIARLHYGLYRYLTAEDGPIEWLGFACFAFAGIMGFRIARLCWRSDRRRVAILYGIFALGMIFAAGEEISWGQRVLDIETPEILEEINKQEELNIHNIGDTLKVLNIIQLGMGAAGAAAYLLNEVVDLGTLLKVDSFLFVPPLFLSTWFLAVFVFRFVRLFFWRDSGFTITKYGEWTEMCLAVGLALFTWLVARRLTHASTAHAAAPALEINPTI